MLSNPFSFLFLINLSNHTLNFETLHLQVMSAPTNWSGPLNGVSRGMEEEIVAAAIRKYPADECNELTHIGESTVM